MPIQLNQQQRNHLQETIRTMNEMLVLFYRDGNNFNIDHDNQQDPIPSTNDVIWDHPTDVDVDGLSLSPRSDGSPTWKGNELPIFRTLVGDMKAVLDADAGGGKTFYDIMVSKLKPDLRSL